MRLALPLLQVREDTLTIIQDDQQRGQEVTHALDVADLDVLPDVAAREAGRNEWATPSIPTQPALSWPASPPTLWATPSVPSQSALSWTASPPTPCCFFPSGPPFLSLMSTLSVIIYPRCGRQVKSVQGGIAEHRTLQVPRHPGVLS